MNQEEVAAHVEISKVLATYCRGVDRCDADLLKSVYHPDGTDDHTDFKGLGWDFAEYITKLCRDMNGVSQHNATNSYIELDGSHFANVDSYYIVHHAFPDPETGEKMVLLALGRYLDRFEKRHGAWKILNRLVTIDWSRYAAAGEPWPGASNFPAIGFKPEDPFYRLFASHR